MRRVAAALAFVCFSACTTIDSDIRAATADGTWQGSSNSGHTLTVTLQQSANALLGSGTLVISGATKNVSVSGNFFRPNLTLSLQSAGESFTLDGIVEGDSFVGNLTGPGITTAVTMALQRK